MKSVQISACIEEEHRLLENMSTILQLRFVRYFLRLYGRISAWLHADVKNKCKLLCPFGANRKIQELQRFRFDENLYKWIQDAHANLDALSETTSRALQVAYAGQLNLSASLQTDPVTGSSQCAPEYSFIKFKTKWNTNHIYNLDEVHCDHVKDLVSVVLPVYNGEDFIEDAIESILAQNYSYFELILVDDGSTDKTPAILDKYAKQDQRISVIHQANQKLPQSLNNGFQRAKGEFFTWTSADNKMHKDCLARLVKELTQDERLALVYADMDLIDEYGKPVAGLNWFPAHDKANATAFPMKASALNTTQNYIGAAFLYRATVAYAIGEYAVDRYGVEDYDYWMRINECFCVKHVTFRDPIYDYRLHSKSLTAQSKQLKIQEKCRQVIAWDDFRRNYLLRPTYWFFSDAIVKSVWSQRLLPYIEAAGYIVIQKRAIWEKLRKNPYHPTIKVVARSEVMYQTETEPYLVSIDTEKSDTSVEGQNGSGSIVLHTSGMSVESEKVFTFSSIKSMFVFLDVQAKGIALTDMEGKGKVPKRQYKELAIVLPYDSDGDGIEQTLDALEQQNVSADKYIIAMPVVAEKLEQAQQKVHQWQSTHQCFLPEITYVLTAVEDQCAQGNAALWMVQADRITFIDKTVCCDKSYVKNLLYLFEKYADAVAVCGKMELAQDPTQQMVAETDNVESAQTIDTYAKYQSTGCIAFRTEALRSVGGLRSGVVHIGAAVATGWEQIAVAKLLQTGGRLLVSNAVCVYSQKSAMSLSELCRLKAMNDFQLQCDGLQPMALSLDTLHTEISAIEDALRREAMSLEQRCHLQNILQALKAMVPAVEHYSETSTQVR